LYHVGTNPKIFTAFNPRIAVQILWHYNVPSTTLSQELSTH
jgi:K+ transporter